MKLESQIAKRIRELRIAKGMTQEQLADKTGVDVSFLGRIERGKSANIQISTLEKIIHALDENFYSFFLFEDSVSREINILHELTLSNNKDELLDIIEKIINLEQK